LIRPEPARSWGKSRKLPKKNRRFCIGTFHDGTSTTNTHHDEADSGGVLIEGDFKKAGINPMKWEKWGGCPQAWLRRAVEDKIGVFTLGNPPS